MISAKHNKVVCTLQTARKKNQTKSIKKKKEKPNLIA
jgi:hypothetical protein